MQSRIFSARICKSPLALRCSGRLALCLGGPERVMTAEERASVLVFGDAQAFRAIPFSSGNDGVMVSWTALLAALERSDTIAPARDFTHPSGAGSDHVDFRKDALAQLRQALVGLRRLMG